MSILIVEYNRFNDLISTSRSLSNALDNRIKDYNGIRNNMRGISSSRGNINQANYFIQKKNEQLESKKNKIDAFRNRITDFKTEVMETDRRVARRITSDTTLFRKVNNINISIFAHIGVAIEELFKASYGRDNINFIKRVTRNVKYEIKDWYYDRGGKYIVNIAIDVVKIGLAAATTAALVLSGAGALAIFFAGFSLYNALATRHYTIEATETFFTTGNRSVADRIDKKGGKERTAEVGGAVFEGTAMVLNQDRDEFRQAGENLGTVLHSGVSIAAAIYGLGKLGTGIKEFYIGKDFRFYSFKQDLISNAQSGNRTFGEVLKSNVTSGSVVKTAKDYKAMQNITLFSGVSKTSFMTNSFLNNFVKEDWRTFTGLMDNYDSIKDIVTGEYSYNFVPNIKENIKKGYENTKGIFDVLNTDKKKAIRIDRIRLEPIEGIQFAN